MRSRCRVVGLAAPALFSTTLLWLQIGTTPREQALLVVDPVLEYSGPPNMPTFETPAITLIRRISDFWSIPLELRSRKGHVIAAAKIDALGAIGELSIVQPSPITAFNTAALDTLARLKATPLVLAEYPPNRRKLTVTFYYNEASTPGPVAPPAGWPPERAFRSGDGVTVPKVLREARPQYTGLAMQAGIQGTVLIEAVVEKTGTIVDAIVIDSLDQTFGLDQEAMNTIKHWQFVPGTRMGEPVAVIVRTPVTFTLK